jgi:hypothetical protein
MDPAEIHQRDQLIAGVRDLARMLGTFVGEMQRRLVEEGWSEADARLGSVQLGCSYILKTTEPPKAP